MHFHENSTKFIKNIQSYHTSEQKAILELMQAGAELSNLGRHEKALTCYDEALSIAPNDSNVLVNKANSLVNMGRYEDAMEYCNQALSQNPDSDMALYNKACVLALIGEFSESIELLEKAIDLNSDLREIAKTDGAFLPMRNLERFRILFGL